MADAEVVIVANDGTEHVFPPGFDPKKAAAIVRGQASAPSSGPVRNYLTGADGGPSVAGFAQNTLSSGVQFAQDILGPVLHPQAVHEGAMAAWRDPKAAAGGMLDAVKKRYGSLDALLNTVYSDPVGAASDASVVAGGVGAVAKGAGASKLARLASGTAEVLNPLALAGKSAEAAGQATYKTAINPSRRIRRGFSGALDEGWKGNVLPTEGGLTRAENALEASAAKTQGHLQEADRRGAPGVDMRGQVVSNLKEPAQRAGERYKLGKPDERPAISDRAKDLARRNTKPIPLTQANKLKQEAQKMADSAFRAEERGAVIKDLEALSDEKVAQALRKAIEVNAEKVGVTELAGSNQKTQALIGLAQAIEDATQQPSRLTHLMSTLGGVGGALAGGPATGGAAYAVGRIATAKPVMAATGLAVGKAGSATLRKAQLLRALAVLKASQAQQ